MIEQRDQSIQTASEAFEERHFPVAFWAEKWGFSPKTVRDWFRDEYCQRRCKNPHSAGPKIPHP
jgi:hypothetical protein